MRNAKIALRLAHPVVMRQLGGSCMTGGATGAAGARVCSATTTNAAFAASRSSAAATTMWARNIITTTTSTKGVDPLPHISSPTPDLDIEASGQSRTIVLNRPKVLNSLNLAMVNGISDLVRAWDADENVSAIVMKGAGKAFCAGGDVVAVAHAVKDGVVKAPGAPNFDFFHDEYVADHDLAALDTPYISLLDGVTMGGGVGVSVHGRYRVATERTLFAMPETKIGLFPDVGGTFFLPRLTGRLGWWLALSGARLRGPDVLHAGIATHYVPSEELPALECALAGVTGPEQVAGVLDRFHDASADASEAIFAPHIDAIDRCFAANSGAEIMEALVAEGSEWAAEQHATIASMSPLSVAVTCEALNRGAALPNLARVLEMEFRMTQAAMEAGDFYEGVRALLIDKDNAPTWRHGAVADVSEEEIEAFFAPLEHELTIDV